MFSLTATTFAAPIGWADGHVTGTGYWTAGNAVKLTEDVTKATNGALKVTVFPGSTLSTGADAMNNVTANVMQMAGVWGSHVAGQEQIMELFDLPMFVPWDFEFRTKLWDAMYPDFAEMLHKKHGIWLMTMLQVEPRMIYTKRPIKSLDELKGVKIRSMGPVETSFTRALGATPVPVEAAEIYTALQQGLVDGNWFPDSAQYAFKFHEVTRYIFDLNNAGAGYFVMVSEKALDGLPANVRQEFMGLRDLHSKRLRESSLDGTKKGRSLLEGTGMKANVVPAADRKRIMSMSSPIVEEWAARLPADTRPIYLKAKRLVDEYNASH
ncbi:MAG: TRAP transporter substrate-binding protein [Candidatus Lambdaproteobacteria bacterium]|nr:TRAP transporter substrate-binding protein [Candidatus Lambdaproteobacteria bacterium]